MFNTKLKATLAFFLALFSLLLCSCGSKTDEDLNINDVVISNIVENEDLEEADGQGTALPCATDGNVSYSSSVYLLMMQESFQEVSLSTGLELSRVLDTVLKLSDGSECTAAEFISSDTEESFRRHYVTERICREAGLEVKDSSYYSMCLYYASQAYQSDSEYYDYFNIGIADLLEYYMSKYRYNDLFFTLYGKGGEREIGQDRLEELMDKGAYRLQTIMLPFTDSDGVALSEAECTARKELCMEYLQRYENGEAFDKLVFESYKYLDQDVQKNKDTNYDYYGSVSEGFTQEIRECAEGLDYNVAAFVEGDSYCAVILRLPVNEDRGDKWLNAALQLAYVDAEGNEFDLYMSEQFETIEPKYNKGVMALLTPENYAQLLEEYTAS